MNAHMIESNTGSSRITNYKEILSDSSGVCMSEIREGLLYTEEHEWAKVEGDRCRIGITDHAQNELTEVVYAEVPELGRKVRKGEPIGAVESVKTIAEVYAPVSGEIVESNSDLEESPQLVNESPYELGWFAVIKMEDQSELDSLMSADRYRSYIGE